MSALKRLGLNKYEYNVKKRYSNEQEQTEKCFEFKWSKRDSYESDKMKRLSKKWLIERYCGGDLRKLAGWLDGGRKIILDAGCGTGGHAIPLARRGYKVTCLDASEAMLTKAKQKSEQARLHLDFGMMDLRQICLSGQFDAAIAMFDVMDYFTTDEDLQKVLRNIRGVLKSSALFTFDFWNGLAVPRMFREVSLKEVWGEGE